MERDANSSGDTSLSLRLPCPGCGGEIRLSSTAEAARCPYCSMSHLVARTGATPVFSVPDRTREAGGALLLAPYLHVALRLHDAVFGVDGSGRKRVAAAALRTALTAATATVAEHLPERGLLSSVPDVAPFRAEAFPEARLLASESEGDALARLREELPEPRLVDGITPMARRGVIAGLGVARLLWPWRLVGTPDRPALLDAFAGGEPRALEPAAAEALRRASGAVEPSGGSVVFRPMRCPDCASAFPLDEPGQVRFCPGCSRAWRVVEGRLERFPYRVERPPSGPCVALPHWRFRFALEDPRDGVSVTTREDLAERLGGRSASGGSNPFLDVPAFLPEERRRAQRRGGQPFAPPPRDPGEEPVEGPARVEWGFRTPARFVAILEEEAGSLARSALALGLPDDAVQAATGDRLAALLFEAPLELRPPELVLRALPRDAAPATLRMPRRG